MLKISEQVRIARDRIGFTVHELKTWPEPFAAVVRDDKRFEYRRNDRDFQVGHLLHLRQWNPETEEYTGHEAVRYVSYVLTEGFGLPEGMCILSLQEWSVPSVYLSQ